MSQGWEEIDHTADWALHVWAEDLRGLFEAAAQGMVSLIAGRADPGGVPVEQTFSLDAPDVETLLVDWLTELLYLVEEENAVFTRIIVQRVEGLHLEAAASGRRGGEFSKHIKAVTYHNLAIIPAVNGLETVIVFDV